MLPPKVYLVSLSLTLMMLLLWSGTGASTPLIPGGMLRDHPPVHPVPTPPPALRASAPLYNVTVYKPQVNTSATQRMGKNLCQVCNTTYYTCFYNVTIRCPTSLESNEELVWDDNQTSTETPPGYVPDYYDDWNDDDNDYYAKDEKHQDFDNGDLKGRGRKKRSPSPRRGWMRRPGGRWNNHHNRWRKTTFAPSHTTTTAMPTNVLPTRRCYAKMSKTCSDNICTLECCSGSRKGLLYSTAEGCPEGEENEKEKPLTCKNGGTLFSGKWPHCICPSGYAGRECQTRRCSITCHNGGVCRTNTSRTGSLEDTTHNDDQCVCPSDTWGNFCENKVCSKQCQNNGTCKSIFYSFEKCECQEGFYGDLCEKAHKEGECPPRSMLDDCASWDYGRPRHWRPYHHRRTFKCRSDEDCTGTKKCCDDACFSRTCAEPHNKTTNCFYNNETYSLGSVFYPDACRVCTCNASHVGNLVGVVECTRIVCPEVPTFCDNVTTPEGECCPSCNDDPNAALCAANYTYPYFLNCPNELVVLDVEKDSDLAPVTLNLEARDCTGQYLHVFLSDDYLVAGSGQENFQMVSATTSRDGKGNFAECLFHVRVRDPYPPEFVLCPTDFSEPAPGRVTWAIPVAKDNVGLAITPTSRRHPGDRMELGEHMVQYWAEDLQGNIARCTFIVKVGSFGAHASSHQGHDNNHDHPVILPHPHPHPHPDPHPHTQPHPHSHTHSAVSVAVGVSTTLLVVVLLALALFFYCRQRNKIPMTSSPTTNTDHGVRWSRGDSAHPPHYSLPDDVMSPPQYSRTDEMAGGVGLATGGSEAGELPTKSSFS